MFTINLAFWYGIGLTVFAVAVYIAAAWLLPGKRSK